MSGDRTLFFNGTLHQGTGHPGLKIKYKRGNILFIINFDQTKKNKIKGGS